ncbi:VOC family protein [Yeosuana sp. MJ-SS3]|uniref:VOC family protein n=1 Tax=Gilvirhabdus luticola TaxID=3079858 RepID=A0ABU3U4J5_9FLAO|nr:VOC family protein [Yeosuana sp. MJ-SS3]MDU8885331.1 VOC family protein [Yeosuana sp. MJ-SS3]
MRIDEIILYTSSIQEQKHFYGSVLELKQLVDLPNKISFKIGNSTLTFQYRKYIRPSHLAFNIPFIKIQEALPWLQKRVGIIDFEGKLISDFSNWNAEAIYFYDTDHNIVEFIGRKNLNVESKENFSSKSIISISEMAIATDNIQSVYNTINTFKEIEIFDGNFDRFCALGNDEGLFILINKNKKNWYPSMDKAYTSDFVIRGDYNFSFENGFIKELL